MRVSVAVLKQNAKTRLDISMSDSRMDSRWIPESLVLELEKELRGLEFKYIAGSLDKPLTVKKLFKEVLGVEKP